MPNFSTAMKNNFSAKHSGTPLSQSQSSLKFIINKKGEQVTRLPGSIYERLLLSNKQTLSGPQSSRFTPKSEMNVPSLQIQQSRSPPLQSAVSEFQGSSKRRKSSSRRCSEIRASALELATVGVGHIEEQQEESTVIQDQEPSSDYSSSADYGDDLDEKQSESANNNQLETNQRNTHHVQSVIQAVKAPSDVSGEENIEAFGDENEDKSREEENQGANKEHYFIFSEEDKRSSKPDAYGFQLPTTHHNARGQNNLPNQATQISTSRKFTTNITNQSDSENDEQQDQVDTGNLSPLIQKNHNHRNNFKTFRQMQHNRSSQFSLKKNVVSLSIQNFDKVKDQALCKNENISYLSINNHSDLKSSNINQTSQQSHVQPYTQRSKVNPILFSYQHAAVGPSTTNNSAGFYSKRDTVRQSQQSYSIRDSHCNSVLSKNLALQVQMASELNGPANFVECSVTDGNADSQEVLQDDVQSTQERERVEHSGDSQSRLSAPEVIIEQPQESQSKNQISPSISQPSKQSSFVDEYQQSKIIVPMITHNGNNYLGSFLSASALSGSMQTSTIGLIEGAGANKDLPSQIHKSNHNSQIEQTNSIAYSKAKPNNELFGQVGQSKNSSLISKLKNSDLMSSPLQDTNLINQATIQNLISLGSFNSGTNNKNQSFDHLNILNNHAAGMLAQGHVLNNNYDACDQTGDMLYYKDIEKHSFDFEDNRDHSNSGIVKSETLKAVSSLPLVKRLEPINDLNFLQTLSEGTNEEDDSEINTMQENKNNFVSSHIDGENLNELNCFLKANMKENGANQLSASKNNSMMKMSGSTAKFRMRSNQKIAVPKREQESESLNYSKDQTKVQDSISKSNNNSSVAVNTPGFKENDLKNKLSNQRRMQRPIPPMLEAKQRTSQPSATPNEGETSQHQTKTGNMLTDRSVSHQAVVHLCRQDSAIENPLLLDTSRKTSITNTFIQEKVGSPAQKVSQFGFQQTATHKSDHSKTQTQEMSQKLQKDLRQSDDIFDKIIVSYKKKQQTLPQEIGSHLTNSFLMDSSRKEEQDVDAEDLIEYQSSIDQEQESIAFTAQSNSQRPSTPQRHSRGFHKETLMSSSGNKDGLTSIKNLILNDHNIDSAGKDQRMQNAVEEYKQQLIQKLDYDFITTPSVSHLVGSGGRGTASLVSKEDEYQFDSGLKSVQSRNAQLGSLRSLGPHHTQNVIDLPASGLSNGRRLLQGVESEHCRKKYISAKKHQTEALNFKGQRSEFVERDENLLSSSTGPNLINEENKQEDDYSESEDDDEELSVPPSEFTRNEQEQGSCEVMSDTGSSQGSNAVEVREADFAGCDENETEDDRAARKQQLAFKSWDGAEEILQHYMVSQQKRQRGCSTYQQREQQLEFEPIAITPSKMTPNPMFKKAQYLRATANYGSRSRHEINLLQRSVQNLSQLSKKFGSELEARDYQRQDRAGGLGAGAHGDPAASNLPRGRSCSFISNDYQDNERQKALIAQEAFQKSMDMNVYLLQKIEELDAINAVQHQLLQPTTQQNLYYQNGASNRPSRQNSVHETPISKLPSTVRSRHGSCADSHAFPQNKLLLTNLNNKSPSGLAATFGGPAAAETTRTSGVQDKASGSPTTIFSLLNTGQSFLQYQAYSRPE